MYDAKAKLNEYLEHENKLNIICTLFKILNNFFTGKISIYAFTYEISIFPGEKKINTCVFCRQNNRIPRSAKMEFNIFTKQLPLKMP